MSNLNQNVTHYHPSALIFFVPAFPGDANATSEVLSTVVNTTDTVYAEYTSQVKELNTLHLSRTVRNSPGTFSFTLIDTNNKFIIPDDPDFEITTLYQHTQAKISVTEKIILVNSSQTNTKNASGSLPNNFATISEQGTFGNFYSYKDYNHWLQQTHIIVKNKVTNQAYPTQFSRDQNKGTDPDNPNPVTQRWAFDEYGSIIYVSNSTAEDVALMASLKGKTYIDGKVLTTVDYLGNSKGVSYTIEIHTNAELTEGKWKDPYEQGAGLGSFNRGKCKISPMHRVLIFLSPRFDSNNLPIQGEPTNLIRAFTGVVNTVQQGYAENNNIITVTGEDTSKYLNLSIINVNPALGITPGQIADQFVGQDITVWSHILQGLSTPDIIRLLLLGSNSLPAGEGEALSFKVDGVWAYQLQQSGNAPNLVFNPKYQYNTKTKEFIPATSDKTSKPSADKNIRVADTSGMLGTLFTKNFVHIINPYVSGQGQNQPLKGFRPYELSLDTNFSFYQADFKTRRDIAYKCAEDSNFNFYSDAFGDIWFHPQRFDISWILSAPNPNVYIIKGTDIMSYGFIESDENIYTSVYVSTEPDFAMGDLTQIGYYYNSFRDEPAVLKYGQRIFVASNPIINTKAAKPYNPKISLADQPDAMGNPQLSCLVYAKSLLQRILSSKYQGQVTIGLRAEIDPGRPIYIPIRNMVYYVETVDHDIDFAGRATTTLHLSYGRKPWELLPELLTYSSNDDIYLTDADTIKKFSGRLNLNGYQQQKSMIQYKKSTAISTQPSASVKEFTFDYSTFKNKLGASESGTKDYPNGSYTATFKDSQGNIFAYGRWQFIPRTITYVAGLLEATAPTLEVFLGTDPSSNAIQDNYYLAYAKDIYNYSVKNLSQHIGNIVTGRKSGITATVNYYGLVAGGWLGGTGNLHLFFAGTDTPDMNGTYVSDYIVKFSRLFSSKSNT